MWVETGFGEQTEKMFHERFHFDILPLCKKPEHFGMLQYALLYLNGSPKWNDQFIKHKMAPCALLIFTIAVAAAAVSFHFVSLLFSG